MNRTAAEEKSITLLGQGFGAEQVSSATGLTISRISQIASDPVYSKEIANLRFSNLAKHNERDSKADELEDLLLTRLKETAPLLYRPLEIAKIYSVINAAKRRGQSAPQNTELQNQVVPIVMPVVVINQFTKNGNNQVVQAGNQPLTTIQPHALSKLHEILTNQSTKAIAGPAPAEAEIVGK